MRAALVTGSAGLLGACYAEMLTDLGWRVRGIDLHDGEDFRDFAEVDSDIGYFDLAVHCAANVGGRANIDGNPFWVGSNLGLDCAFVQWAVRCRPKRTILLSSSAAYPIEAQKSPKLGRLAEGLIDPTNAREPDASYGWAKLSLERMAAWAQLPACLIVRPFSGYHPGQSPDYPFSAILGRVRERQDPLVIWSDTIRDFIRVEDIVAGSLAMSGQGVTGPVNMCSGVGTAFSHLAEMMAAIRGYSPEIKTLRQHPGVYYRVGDPTLMRRYYLPRITLAESIEEALSGKLLP